MPFPSGRFLTLGDVRRFYSTTRNVDGMSILSSRRVSKPGVAASTGAACAAGTVEPSHVLKAMGLDRERVEASLRFSIGRFTTEEEVDQAAEQVRLAVDRQRQYVRPQRRGRRD